MRKILLPLILLSALFTLLSCGDDDANDVVKKITLSFQGRGLRLMPGQT